MWSGNFRRKSIPKLQSRGSVFESLHHARLNHSTCNKLMQGTEKVTKCTGAIGIIFGQILFGGTGPLSCRRYCASGPEPLGAARKPWSGLIGRRIFDKDRPFPYVTSQPLNSRDVVFVHSPSTHALSTSSSSRRQFSGNRHILCKR